MRFKIPIIVLSVFALFSCSVQKRHYTKGYYVSWDSKTRTSSTGTAKKKSLSAKSHELTSNPTTAAPENLGASADDKLGPGDLKFKSSKLFPPEDSCDVLIFKDGSEVKVKVTEVGINEIKYKRCNNLDGPNHISRKSEIFMIKYANGTREVVKAESSAEPLKTYESQPRRPAKDTYINNNRRRIHPLCIPSFAVGIANYFVGFYCLVFAVSGFFPYAILVIPLLLAIAAIVMGKIALRDMKEQPENWKGRGFAIPGVVAGFVVGGLALMFLFLFGALV